MTKCFTIIYEFTLPDGSKEDFKLTFDSVTIQLMPANHAEKPFWTRLDFQQCIGCPLTPNNHPYCPVALNLIPAVASFDHLVSFKTIDVRVISAERQVIQQTSAQEGLGSLIGMLIAGSSCPLTHFFKPMARFHLPFANRDETVWRAAASFLLARYFCRQDAALPDLKLEGLAEIYIDAARLNEGVVKRLQAATTKDAAVNALVQLDVFAKYLAPPIEHSLAQLKPIFDPFIVSLKG